MKGLFENAADNNGSQSFWKLFPNPNQLQLKLLENQVRCPSIERFRVGQHVYVGVGHDVHIEVRQGVCVRMGAAKMYMS